MLKYTFKNLLKTIKFYIPLLLILATVLLFLLFSLGTRENTIASNQEYLGKYAAVGIVGRSSNNYMIDEEFIDRFYSSEFTKDYYAFSEFSIGSDMLISTPYTLTVEYEDSVGWGNIVTPEGRVAGINPNFLFTWLVYSDIEKSTHFWLDDRRIIEGRFAENTRECNISIDLAELNGLVLGDEITFYLNYIRSEKITLEIVGIFEDNTEKIINEAVLVEPVSILANRDGIKSVWYGQYVSQNNLSRNQILSVAQTSDELIALNLSDGMAVTEYGYNAVLYYTYDENSVIKYVDWIESMLSNRFVVLDSIAQLRIMSIFYSNVENSVNWLLTIATLICLVLCTLILFFVLKSRIYDIGVFRTRGMPRISVAMFITGEIFVITTFAFIIAMIVYWNTFLNFIRYQYSLEDTALMIQFSNFGKVEGRYFDVLTFRDFLSVHEAFLPTNPYIFIVGFLISILITIIIGLASVLFISRHEPMKIMTKH